MKFHLAALWIGFWSVAANAGLQTFPARIVLTDKSTVAHVSLKHTGNSAGRYTVSAVFYRMNPLGNLELAESPEKEERSAVSLIRVSPKKITVGPNQEKAVRVTFDGAKNLAEGEYRAHILFEPLEGAAAQAKGNAISQSMETKIAGAVPVVYRKGNPEFKVTLSNLGLLRLPDQTPAFRAELISEGNAFAYGDMFAFFTPAGSQSPRAVGVARAVSSYNKRREVQYPLTIPTESNLTNGTFRLEFRHPEDRGGNLITFLEAPVQ